MKFVKLCLAIALLSVGCNSTNNLPQPVILTAQKSVEEPPIKHEDKLSKLGLPFHVKTTTSSVDESQVRDTISDIIIYLEHTYGPPLPSIKSVEVIVSSSGTSRAQAKIVSDEERIVTISPYNLFDASKKYLVHEMFHALYQVESLFYGNERDYEMYAMYAQLRFEYGKIDNNSLKQKLLEEYPELKKEKIDEQSNIRQTPHQSVIKYLHWTLPLLDNTHVENVDKIQNLMVEKMTKPESQKLIDKAYDMIEKAKKLISDSIDR